MKIIREIMCCWKIVEILIRVTFLGLCLPIVFLWLFNLYLSVSIDVENLMWIWLYQFLSPLIYFTLKLLFHLSFSWVISLKAICWIELLKNILFITDICLKYFVQFPDEVFSSLEHCSGWAIAISLCPVSFFCCPSSTISLLTRYRSQFWPNLNETYSECFLYDV